MTYRNRIIVTALLLLASGVILAWDVWTANERTLDYLFNGTLGYGFGLLLGWLWPWEFAPQPRDERGRFTKL